jgi:hypothetical protein
MAYATISPGRSWAAPQREITVIPLSTYVDIKACLDRVRGLSSEGAHGRHAVRPAPARRVAIFAVAATITVLLLASPRSAMARPLRMLILIAAYLVAVAVVVGVIAVRFHYLTDTVAGAAVGTGTVCGLALVLDLIPAVRPSRLPRRSAAT